MAVIATESFNADGTQKTFTVSNSILSSSHCRVHFYYDGEDHTITDGQWDLLGQSTLVFIDAPASEYVVKITVSSDGNGLDAAPSEIAEVSSNIDDILVVANISSETSTVAGDILAIQALNSITEKLNSLYADKITLDSIYADKIALDSIYADKATLDSILADKATLDSIVADKTTLDGFYASKAAIDSLYVIQAKLESLYADKATLDSLFADKATLDSLYGDKTALDSIYADKTKLDSIYADKIALDAVYANATNINTVSGIDANVTTVAGISANVTTVTGIAASVSSLHADKTTLDSLYADKSKLDSIFADKAKLDSLYTDKAKLDSLFADKIILDGLYTSKAAIDSIYEDIVKINSIYADKATIDAVHANATNINTVSGISGNVTTVAGISAAINSLYADKTTLDSLYADKVALDAVYTNLAEILLADDNAAIAATKASESSASAVTAVDAANTITGMTVATGGAGTDAVWDGNSGILTVPIGDEGIQGIQGITGDNGIDGTNITDITSAKTGKTTTVTVDGDFNNAPYVFQILDGADGAGSGDMSTSTYDASSNGIVDNSEKVNGLTVETAVPSDAVFTDTVYDETALSNAVALNTAKVGITTQQASDITTNNAKVSNVSHPLVETAVPVGALFTDTNTTYSVGDGGLTEKNFTSADNTKLDGIATGAQVNVAETYTSHEAITEWAVTAPATRQYISDLILDANGHVTGGTVATETDQTTITGNAGTATKLATARTIDITGDITATAVAFDGTGNIAISASVKDDSHNHTTANVDGLDTALSGKQATLVSNTNIKTVGGTSLLGSGDIPMSTLSIASQAEAESGTNDTKAMTPLKVFQSLGGGNQSLLTNGYQKLPGGMIMQWGYHNSETSTRNITFPISFPNSVFSISIGLGYTASHGTYYGHIDNQTTSGFTIHGHSAISAYWIAIGK